MKYIYLLLLLPFSQILSAQSDNLPSLSVAERAQMFDILHRRAEQLPVVLKWNTKALLPIGSGFTNANHFYSISSPPTIQGRSFLALEADLEGKITRRITLNAGFELVAGTISPEALYKDTPEKSTWTRFRLEARYYLHSVSEQVPLGPYLAAQYASSAALGNNLWVYYPDSYIEKSRLGIRFGAQWRLFRGGYVDFSYGVGFSEGRGPDFTISPAGFVQLKHRYVPFVEPHLGVGLMLLQQNQKRDADREQWRALFRRYQEVQMWRIGLLEALQLPNDRQIATEIPLSYERKIGNTAWSVGAETRGWYVAKSTNWNPVWSDGSLDRRWGYEMSAELRHYALQRKSRLKGTSGNNLWGPYWGIRAAWNREWTKGMVLAGDVGFDNARAIETQKWIAPVIGFQLRVQRNLFLGYQAGFGPMWTRQLRFYDSAILVPSQEIRWRRGYWFSNMRLGFAF